MKAAILARVSTEEQAGPAHYSLGGQVEKMTRYAAAKGWEVARIFEIPGESAYTDEIAKRPEFAAALEAAERHEFDVLLIDEISRFARDQYVAHQSMRRLRKAGVQLWAVSMDMEMTGNPLMAGIFAAVAEENSRLQGVKIAAAKARRASTGLHIGDVPFGYRSVGAGQPLEVVEAEAEAVRWAFARYCETGSPLEIAQELTRRGFIPHSKHGKQIFERSNVASMLENPFYTGVVTHQGRTFEGQHAAIVSQDLYDRVAAKKKAPMTRLPRAQKMCSGLVVCSECSKRMITQLSNRKDYYYRHPNALDYTCERRKNGLKVELVHAQIDRVFGAIDYRDESWLAYVNQRERTVAAPVKGEREAIEEEQRRLNAQYRKGYVGEYEYEEAMADILRRKQAIPLALDGMRPAMRTLRSFADVWSVADEDEKREAVRIVLEGVEADVATRLVRVRPREEYAALFGVRADWADIYCGTPGRNRTAGSEYRWYSPDELAA